MSAEALELESGVARFTRAVVDPDARQGATALDIFLRLDAACFAIHAKDIDAALTAAPELAVAALITSPERIELAHCVSRLIRAGRVPKNLDGFLKLPPLTQDHMWSRHDVAVALMDMSDLDRAQDALIESQRRFPDMTPPLTGLARIALLRNDLAAAIDLLRRAFALDPNNGRIGFQLASAFAKAQRYAEAQEGFLALAGFDEYAKLAAVEAYRCARCAENRVAARRLLASAFAVDPDNVELKQEMAAALRDDGRLDEALRLYDDLLRDAPNDVWALMGKGLTERRRRNRPAALQCLIDACRAAPDEQWAAVELAIEYREMGDFAASRETLLRFLERRPENAACRLHLGLTARAAGDLDAARACFAALVECGAEVDAQVELAKTLGLAGRSDEARRLLETALESAPRDSQLLFHLAQFESQSGRLSQARALLERAVVAAPDSLWACLDLARALASLGETKAAIATLEQALQRLGPRAEIFRAKAEILRRVGLLADARRTLAEGALIAPQDFNLAIDHILLEIEFGEFDTALQRLTALPAHTPEENYLALIARAQLWLGQWRIVDARNDLRAAQRINEKLPWMYSKLVTSDLLLLDFDAARADLQRQIAANLQEISARGWSRNISQSHLGQLYDEFRLDAAAVAALRIALACPDERRLAALQDVVRRFPDATLPGIQLFIEMRRRGLPPRGALTPGASPIPRRICQFWDDPAPPDDIERYMSSWRDAHAAWAYERHDQTSAQRFLEANCDVKIASGFRWAREAAMKADIFRLAWLFVCGGFYVDADDRCNASIESVQFASATLILHQEDLASIGNNFIGAAPQHPVVGQMLEGAVDAVLLGGGDMVWLSTGPGLITRVLAHFIATGGLNADDSSLVILDRHELLKLSSIHCHAAYKASDRHWVAKLAQAR